MVVFVNSFMGPCDVYRTKYCNWCNGKGEDIDEESHLILNSCFLSLTIISVIARFSSNIVFHFTFQLFGVFLSYFFLLLQFRSTENLSSFCCGVNASGH